MSNASGFMPVLPASVMERALIADYLLTQGVFFCELYSLAEEDAWRLFDAALAYARRKAASLVNLPFQRRSRFCAGFSLN